MNFAATLFVILICASATSAGAADDDYRAQRLALAAQPGYVASSYQGRQSALIRKAREAWAQGKIDESRVPLDELIDFYPLSIMGHAALSEVLAKRAEFDTDPARREHDAASAQSHREIADRLVASITQGTRCASIADGCKVINIPEEYEVVRALSGGRSKQQALLPNNGVPFDAITTEKPGGETSNFYFDISAFFKGFQPPPK